MALRDLVQKNRSSLTLGLIVVGCLISLSVSTDNLALKPKEIGQSVVGLLQQTAAAVGGFFSGTVNSVRELSKLRDQHEELLLQLREYETVSDDVVFLTAENQRLREALDFAESVEFDNIPAQVIGKEPGNFFDGLTINKGRNAGIARHSPVIANQNGYQGLVGRVVEVGATTSTVMPVFDVDSFVAARLLKSRHEGLVAGGGDFASPLVMHYVAKAARGQISVDDVIITSGMRSIFPAGIRIGTVETILGRPYETSLRIELSPAVDFNRLEYVFVVAQTDPQIRDQDQ